MFRRIWRARFSSKYAANLLIILFIVRSVSSLIESDVSGRIGNATANLRLTRQKVLIQAVQGPKNPRGIRLTREKYGIDNRDNNAPPDIVIEELRIRAKINFPASRTCKDLLRDVSGNKKSRIGFSSSRDRRLIYCHAESLKHASKNEKSFESKSSPQSSNDKSISSEQFTLRRNFILEMLSGFSNKRFMSNDTEKENVPSGDFHEKLTEKWNNSFITRKSGEKQKISSKEQFLQNGVLQSHRTSESKMNINSSDKKKSEYLETKKEEIGQENEVNFKPKVLNSFGTFYRNVDKDSTSKEISELRKIKSTENEEEMENINNLSFFDDHKIVEIKNNELGFSPASYDFEKKFTKRSVNVQKISQPCHEKPKTINVTNYFAALELNKRKEKIGDDRLMTSHKFSKKSDNEKTEFHRREKRSLKIPDNSTHFSNNPNKAPKKTGKLEETKKHKAENSTRKSQNELAKSSVRKTRNLTEGQMKLEKPSNNTMWNLTMPPVFTKYLTFMMSFLKPFIDISTTKNQNVSTSVRKNTEKIKVTRFSDKTHSEHFPNTAETHSPNATQTDFPTSTETNFSPSTEINFSPTVINFPTSTEIDLPNSTEINFLNSTKINVPKVAEIDLQNSEKNYFPNTTEMNILKLAEITFSNSTSTTLTTLPQREPVLKKISNHPEINFDDTFLATKAKESNFTNPLKSMIGSENVFNKSGLNYQTTEIPLNTQKSIADTLSAGPKNNEGKKSVIEMSAIIPSIATENSSTIFNEITSEKPKDFQKKAVLNFTGPHSNVTDSIVLNTLPNSTANQSVNISEVTSTYPTLRRYSRNDTLEQIGSPKSKINDAKSRQTKNSLNNPNSPYIVRKSHGNRGRKRSRYKGKMQQPFSANSLPRVGKQSWRNRNNVSVISTPSVIMYPSVTSISTLATIISTLPVEIIDSSYSANNEKSTLPTILQKLQESSLSTVALPTEQQDSPNSIVSDYVTHHSEKGKIDIFASTEFLRNEILHPMSTTSVDEFSGNKELETSTVSSETSADSNFTRFFPNEKIVTNFYASETKSDETVAINKIFKKTLTELSTLPYDNTISVDPPVKKKLDNSIISNESEINSGQNLSNTKIDETTKIEVTESPSILENSATLKIVLPVESEPSNFSNDKLKVASVFNRIELSKSNQTAKQSTNKEKNIPEEVNNSSSTAEVIQKNLKQKLQNSILETRNTESFPEKQLNNLHSSTYLPEKEEDNFVTKSTTEFNLRNKEVKKLKEETATSLENIELNASSERSKDDMSLKVSSSNLDNTTDNLVTGNSDNIGQAFFSKTQFSIASPTTISSSVKKNTTDQKFLTRKIREARMSSENEEPEEPTLDYDIDSSGGNEPITENMPTTKEDNAESLSGASTQKNPSLGVDLPHSAVHEIFLKEKKGTEEIIPDLYQPHYSQSLPVSTVESSNSLDLPMKLPDNLTNYMDPPELLTMVKGLEKFLFDDSVTGTSDRKQFLKNRDLDAESSNRNLETRSAIFKTKKLSVNNKNEKSGKKFDGSKNWGKTKLREYTKKKTSNFLSTGKRFRPKTNRTTRKIITDKENEKRKKGKKTSLKANNLKNFKTQSNSKVRRTSEKKKEFY